MGQKAREMGQGHFQKKPVTRQTETGAIEDFYDLHQSALATYLRVLMKDDETAKEIMQETFAAVCHAPDLFFQAEYPKHYLFCAARNLALKKIRGAQRRNLAMKKIWHSRKGESFWFKPKNGEDDDELRADLAKLQAKLSRMNEDDREVITLKAFSGFSFEEIGGMFGISAPAVHKRYHQALERLKKDWQISD